jgi:thiamine biosynthesis lipoprotein
MTAEEEERFEELQEATESEAAAGPIPRRVPEHPVETCRGGGRANRAASSSGRTAMVRLMLIALLAVLLTGGMGWPGGPAGDGPPAAGGARSSPDARRSVTYPARTMGTYASIVMVTADSVATAPHARVAHAVFARVDSLMSNWTSTSEVARLNREASSGATPVHPEVAVVLDASIRIWRESAGAFDITVEPLVRLWGFLGGPRRVPLDHEVEAAFQRVGTPKLDFDRSSRTLSFQKDGVKIDLGGIAKGYAVDAAAETLRSRGITNALVDISGNMFALGSPPGSNHWRVGIRDPRDRVPFFGRLLLTGQGVATSGKYEQFVAANGKTYGHILDPRTGRPAEGLVSVTVVAPTAMLADAWGTALFVLGPAEAKRKARERDDLAAVLVEPGSGGVDTVWVERALKERFTIEAPARGLFRVEYF